MTEPEARTKWCPFARAFSPVMDEHAETVAAASVNRQESGADPWCRCLASDCMAWRWDERHQTELNGYCGLAGKP